MKKIKVLQVNASLSNGGVEKLLTQWYEKAKLENIEFEFLVFEKGGSTYNYFIEHGCKVNVLKPVREVGFVKYFKQLNLFFKKNKYDIIHCPASTASFIILVCAKLNGIKNRFSHAHINRFDNDSVPGIKRILINLTKKLNVLFSTNLLTCSKEAAGYCFSKKLVQNDKVELINNGIDIKKFKFDQQLRDITREELKINEKFVVGTIGRLSYQKNTEFLLDIFYEVTRINRESVLLIVGEGENEKVLKEKCEKLNIYDNVKFLGVMNDVSKILLSMDAFVLPSRSEGLPIVSVEAQTSGVQCYFSTAVPSEAKIIDSTTFLSLQDSPKKWAETILSHRNSTRFDKSSEIQKAGYDKNESTQHLIQLYKKVSNTL